MKDPGDTTTADPPQGNPALRTLKSIVFTLVGVGLMIGASCWAASTWRFVVRAAIAPGTVVKLNAGGAHPEIRFTTAAGQAVEYPQGGMIWGYHAGEKVEVLYDPQNPTTDPVINTSGALWGFTAMDFLLGTAFVMVAQLARRMPDLVG